MQLPADFILKYQQLFKEPEASQFLASFETEPLHGFRINPLKQATPVQEDLSNPIAYSDWGYYGRVSGKTSDHQSGAVYSQEPSAMYVGEVASPQPGEKVLDLCAAPGGKTTHLGSFLNNTGFLLANEIDASRSQVLTENVERFGMTNTIVTNTDTPTLAKHLPEFFDRLLVDAPCSGEGMFRKDPNATTYWSLDYPKECAMRQKEILTDAVKVLRPGGELIYSTCTFAPEEDEQIVAWLVKEYGFEILPVKKYPQMSSGKPEWADGNPDLTNCVRLFPHLFPGEGHFIAKLRKPGSDSQVNQKPAKNINPAVKELNKEQAQLWQQFAKTHLNTPVTGKLVVFKDQLYSIPEQTPNLTGIKISRLGLWLGTFKKNRFEPSYTWALALHPTDWQKVLTITADEWQKYVAGETFTCDASLAKDWYLLVHDQQPIGFGKVVNGTVKNFFPKRFRFNL